MEVVLGERRKGEAGDGMVSEVVWSAVDVDLERNGCARCRVVAGDEAVMMMEMDVVVSVVEC